MFERMVGEKGQENADKGEAWTWAGVWDGRGRQHMTANECERAVKGDLGEEENVAAVAKLWACFKQHTSAVHGRGRRAAQEVNAREEPDAARISASEPLINH